MIYSMKKSKYWFAFSIVMLSLGIFTIVNNVVKDGTPFNLGIDFTGGVSITAEVASATEEFNSTGMLSDDTSHQLSQQIRTSLEESGIENLQLTTIDKYLFSLKVQQTEGLNIKELTKKLITDIEGTTILGTDFIGPSIGQELQKQAISIIGVAILLLLIYITFRFEFWAAVSAILALLHDGLIVLGMTALLQIEVNTAYVAAILTVLGYSINDTIVIFDRIRENLKDNGEKLNDVINHSISQTITRSINTSITTMVVLLSIYLFGGASLKDFALALLIGIISGTYSSIFIASPLLYRFKKLNQ